MAFEHKTADAEHYKEDVLSAPRHLQSLTPFPVACRRRDCPSNVFMLSRGAGGCSMVLGSG